MRKTKYRKTKGKMSIEDRRWPYFLQLGRLCRKKTVPFSRSTCTAKKMVKFSNIQM